MYLFLEKVNYITFIFICSIVSIKINDNIIWSPAVGIRGIVT